MDPIRPEPRFVEKMWGGRRLADVLGKDIPDGPIGESWEAYDFPPGVIEAGRWVSAATDAGGTIHELMTTRRAELLGPHAAVETPDGPQFPLLIKFLDAKEDLSVQVHPDEAYAAAHAGAHLKNECWTTLEHEPGARLLAGLEPGVTAESFEEALERGQLEQLLRKVPAKTGVTQYLPSGTVHALGAGMLVAEIQTPSDTTYRVYDFDRVDPSTGKKRQLHVEQALACINFGDPNPPDPVEDAGEGDVVVSAPQFTVTRRESAAEDHFLVLDEGFSVLVGLSDVGSLGAFGELRRGDVVILPHDRPALEIGGRCTFLETRLPTP